MRYNKDLKKVILRSIDVNLKILKEIGMLKQKDIKDISDLLYRKLKNV